MSRRGKKRGQGNGWDGFGGYMAAKKQKLHEQFMEERSTEQAKRGVETNIFKGVAIYVNGYTNPTSFELKRLMMLHGGRYIHYLNKTSVTHIIASNLPNSKVKDMKKDKVVRPEWITDSIKAGKLLSYVPYQLYTAKNKNIGQTGVEMFANRTLVNETVADSKHNVTTECCQSIEEGGSQEKGTSICDGASGEQNEPSGLHEQHTNNIMLEEECNDSNSNPFPFDVKDKKYLIDHPNYTTEKSPVRSSPTSGLNATPESPESSTVSLNTKSTISVISPSTSSDLATASPQTTASPHITTPVDRTLPQTTATSQPNTCSTKSTGKKSSNTISTEGTSTSLGAATSLMATLPTSLNATKSTDKVSTASLPTSPNYTKSTDKVSTASLPTSPDATKSTDKVSTATTTAVQKTTPSPKKAVKAGDPNFVSEFYNHSRLHHISTWGAEFKSYVNQLQLKGSSSFPGREKLKAMKETQPDEEGFMDNFGNERKCKSKTKHDRVIMHVDMDSFFVSVGLRNRPDLVGKPVAVTHSKGKGAQPRPGTDLEYEKAHWRKTNEKKSKSSSAQDQIDDLDIDNENEEVQGQVQNQEQSFNSMAVQNQEQSFNSMAVQNQEQSFNSMADIASCSYEARQAGVKNGMSMGPAKKLCPNLVTIPYDFEGYKTVAQQLYEIIASYTHEIEAVSCDEMFVDCTELLSGVGMSPLEFAAVVRKEIRDATGCNASAGLSCNILLARMATRKAKPNGQFYLEMDKALDYLKDQPVKDLPGVGWSLSKKLQTMNILTCGDLQKAGLSTLQKEFGPKTGQSLFQFCRGQDDRPIKVERERKSVSAEINYGIRFMKNSEVEQFLSELSQEVHTRMSSLGVKGRCVTLKLKVRRPDAPVETAKYMGHGICDSIAKSATLTTAMNDPAIISKECVNILKPLKVLASDIRGIGIQVHKLEDNKSKPGTNISILNFTKQISNKQVNKNQAEVHLPYETGTSTQNELKSGSSTSTNSDDQNAKKTLFDIEIARRKMARKILPPLPALPTFDSPSVSGQIMGDRAASTPKYGMTAKPGDLILPSPSQVDVDVLNELPPDIRVQIEQQMRGGNRPRLTQSTGTISPQPGCSSWTQNEADPVVNKEMNPAEEVVVMGDNSEAIVPLPSLSQLDMSILESLPPEMQNEIKAAYESEARKKELRDMNNDAEQRLSAYDKMKSPTKQFKKTSPKKGKKNSPLFKVPHGRPGRKKKFSPKKLSFKEISKTKDKSQVKQPLENISVKSKEIDNLIEEEKQQDKGCTYRKEQVNLCGAVTLKQVKSLIKEWLASCEAPEDDDITMIIHYLSQLVQDKNLEQVDLVLKFLKRQVKKLNQPSWCNGFDSILNSTQTVVEALHGCKLKFT